MEPAESASREASQSLLNTHAYPFERDKYLEMILFLCHIFTFIISVLHLDEREREGGRERERESRER